MKKPDGGPAFPISLRDYFAAHATEKEIDNIMFDHINSEDVEYIGPVKYSITRQEARYVHADTMLAAREK